MTVRGGGIVPGSVRVLCRHGMDPETCVKCGMVDAYGYDALSVRKLRDELTRIIDNWPQLADAPVWADPGPPLVLSAKNVGIRPGARGRDMADTKVVIGLNR